MNMIAHYGLDCSTCEAYLATKEDDDESRAETAERWSEIYGVEMNPEDINCVGCLEKGVHVAHWNECEVRICSSGRDLDSCAQCEDYICDTLQGYFDMAPEMKENLEKIREQ